MRVEVERGIICAVWKIEVVEKREEKTDEPQPASPRSVLPGSYLVECRRPVPSPDFFSFT